MKNYHATINLGHGYVIETWVDEDDFLHISDGCNKINFPAFEWAQVESILEQTGSSWDLADEDDE